MLRTNGIPRLVASCLASLPSVTFARFAHIVAHISASSLYTAEKYSTVRTNHTSFTRSSVRGNSGCFTHTFKIGHLRNNFGNVSVQLATILSCCFLCSENQSFLCSDAASLKKRWRHQGKVLNRITDRPPALFCFPGPEAPGADAPTGSGSAATLSVAKAAASAFHQGSRVLTFSRVCILWGRRQTPACGDIDVPHAPLPHPGGSSVQGRGQPEDPAITSPESPRCEEVRLLVSPVCLVPVPCCQLRITKKGHLSTA